MVGDVLGGFQCSDRMILGHLPIAKVSDALSGAYACPLRKPVPTRRPLDFTLFTRLISRASSGASSTAAASLRIADTLIVTEDDPS